jgi:hypothetical protein
MPRSGGPGVRLELPQPQRFPEPGVHVLVAHAPLGTLPGGRHEVRADASVSAPGERQAAVIVRGGGRIRIAGDDPDDELYAAAPEVEHWDGQVMRRVEADWSID